MHPMQAQNPAQPSAPQAMGADFTAWGLDGANRAAGDAARPQRGRRGAGLRATKCG